MLSSQTLEAVGLTISTADLFLALLTGGGAYGGTRAAASHRMQLEDRRKLHDTLFRQIATPESGAEPIRYYLGGVYQAGLVIELLPWTERSMWRWATNAMPSSRLDSSDVAATSRQGTDYLEEGDATPKEAAEFRRRCEPLDKYVRLSVRPQTLRIRWKRRTLQIQNLQRAISNRFRGQQ